MCGNGSVLLLLLGTCFDLLWSFVVRWRSAGSSCATELRLASSHSRLGPLCCGLVAGSSCCWMVSPPMWVQADIPQGGAQMHRTSLMGEESGPKRVFTVSAKVPGESSCHWGSWTFTSNRQISREASVTQNLFSWLCLCEAKLKVGGTLRAEPSSLRNINPKKTPKIHFR